MEIFFPPGAEINNKAASGKHLIDALNRGLRRIEVPDA